MRNFYICLNFYLDWIDFTVTIHWCHLRFSVLNTYRSEKYFELKVCSETKHTFHVQQLFSIRLIAFKGRDSSVGIATHYGLDVPGGRIPVGGEIFHTRPYRPWGPTQPPVQWVPGLSQG